MHWSFVVPASIAVSAANLPSRWQPAEVSRKGALKELVCLARAGSGQMVKLSPRTFLISCLAEVFPSAFNPTPMLKPKKDLNNGPASQLCVSDNLQCKPVLSSRLGQEQIKHS
jgi:hypothetical protein